MAKRKTVSKNKKSSLIGRVFHKTLSLFNKYKMLIVFWGIKGVLGVALAGLIAFSIHKSLPTIKNLFGDGALFNTFKFVYEELEIPDFEKFVTPNNDNVKKINVKKVLVLKDSNTLLLRGDVTFGSVARVMQSANKKSLKLSPGIPLYLVVDTEGGSVAAGKDLISFLQALPRKVHTLTLLSSSMGFHIVQNLNKRYVLSNGLYISHNMIIDGLKGQWGGDLEQKIKTQKKLSDYSNYVASKRIGMTLKQYQEFIRNDVAIFGYEAVKLKVADEVVLARCDKSLKGAIVKIHNNPYTGKSFLIRKSKCPLIRGVLKSTPFRRLLDE